MKFAVFASLMATALSAPAFASDWVLVAESVRDSKYYIDRQSIRTMPNGYKRAWERHNYDKPTKYGDTSSRHFIEYDCSGGRYRFLSGTYFKGEEVTTMDSTIREWNYVAPDTIAEGSLNFVCYGMR